MRPTHKKLEIPSPKFPMNKSKLSMVFSSKPRKVITLLISQVCCQVSKPEANGMHGRPKKERVKKMPPANTLMLLKAFSENDERLE